MKSESLWSAIGLGEVKLCELLMGYDVTYWDRFVKSLFVFVLAFAAVAPTCRAETRWCSVTGRGAKDHLEYPDFARLARAFGVVESRIVFAPNGRVVEVERLSGSPLLASFLTHQLADWTIKTDAEGEELCQSIVVVEFNLGDVAKWRVARVEEDPPPAVLRLEVAAEPYSLDTEMASDDPSPSNSSRVTFRKVKNGFAKTFSKVFATH